MRYEFIFWRLFTEKFYTGDGKPVQYPIEIHKSDSRIFWKKTERKRFFHR